LDTYNNGSSDDDDRNADAHHFLEPPADEPPILEERGENQGEDHDDRTSSASKPRWRDDFPHPAGQGIRREPTAFESLRDAQIARGESIWGVFLNEGDWALARWILKSGTTHTSTDELLELKTVSQ
jgi:hypothetical protein